MELDIVDPEIADALERKAAAEARTAARRAEEAVAEKKTAALDAAALACAIADVGDVGDAISTVATKAGRLIVRKPTAARWRQATKDMETRDQAKLEEHAKQLVKDHLVHPSEAEYFKIAERYPALPGELIALIGGLARGGARALSGE